MKRFFINFLILLIGFPIFLLLGLSLGFQKIIDFIDYIVQDRWWSNKIFLIIEKLEWWRDGIELVFQILKGGRIIK